MSFKTLLELQTSAMVFFCRAVLHNFPPETQSYVRVVWLSWSYEHGIHAVTYISRIDFINHQLIDHWKDLIRYETEIGE
jgi:hypothetical protein